MIVSRIRRSAIDYRFAVFAYCVMPDHFHTLLIGVEPSSNLLNLVLQFKGVTAEDYRSRNRGELWQKKYYDRILRDRDDNHGVAEYIWLNPVRANLVADPAAWEFSGDFKQDHPTFTDSPGDWLPPWRR